MKSRFIDLTDRRFGRFTVLTFVGKDRHKQNIWLCLCDCGSHFTRTGSNILAVTRGTAVGTGCLKCANAATGRARTTHGEARVRKTGKNTPLYRRWSSMKRRCTQRSYHGYQYYGGKGIKICAAWLDFAAFRSWALANGFKDHLTLDRLDSSKDYQPDNCQWVTSRENIRRMHVSHGHKTEAIH